MSNAKSNSVKNKINAPEYTPVCKGVLDRISEESITPRSRIFFQTKECVVWSVWFFAVLFGALSLAVLFFIGGTVTYDPYFSDYSNVGTFLLIVLPLVWLIVLVSTIYLAYVNLRHTRYGYRYRTVTVLVAGGSFIFLIGAALEQRQYGAYVDSVLGDTFPGYVAYSDRLYEGWHQPEKSWYTGTLVMDKTQDGDMEDGRYVLKSHGGETYTLDVTDMSPEVRAEFTTLAGQNIRMVATSTGPNGLLVCDVLPVVMSKRSHLRSIKAAKDCLPN